MDKKDELIKLQNEIIELMDRYFECFDSNVDKYYKLKKEIEILKELLEEKGGEEEEEIEILLG